MIELRAAGLWVRDGAALLVEHEKRGERYWVLPGGHVEEGETLAQTVAREFLEEVGIAVRVGPLLWVNDILRPYRTGVDIYFAVEPEDAGAEPRQIATGSVRGARFFRADELQVIDFRPPIAEGVSSYVRTGVVSRVYLGPK